MSFFDDSLSNAVPGGNLATQGADEITRRRLCFGFGTQNRQRLERPGGRDFLALDGEDALEDVGLAHAENVRVKRTNSSSLARAAPLAMASRAMAMPCGIDSATLAT